MTESSSSSVPSAISPSRPAADRAGYPRRGSPAGIRFGSTALRLAGWTIVGTLPDRPRLLLIAAPHTSNWDSCLCLLAMFALDLRVNWLAKHSMFRFPAGAVFRWLGGIAVDRSAGSTATEMAVARFATGDPWVLALAPEGTRKRVSAWKTGFYRIAVVAGVPIVPVAIDYAERQIRIMGAVVPVAGQDETIRRLHALYHPRMARYPEQFAPAG